MHEVFVKGFDSDTSGFFNAKARRGGENAENAEKLLVGLPIYRLLLLFLLRVFALNLLNIGRLSNKQMVGISNARWLAHMPVRRQLELVRRPQQLRFLKVIANQLQPHRHAVCAKARRHAHAGQAGQAA